VKVRNLSCVPSSGSEKLKIYWAKANTSYAWPDYWNGTAVNDQGIPLSSELPSVDIPVIQPGQEVVVAVPWVVPNPENYSDMEEPWHYCIMARVESENDPMTFPETADSGENIRNNNNIAQKNVSIVNPSPGNPIGATVGVGNAFPVSRDFVFEFQDKTETGKFLYREAEITIRLDDRLLQTWKNSGGALNNMKQVSDNTFLITDNYASFGSLKFEPHQIDLLTLNFNFLTSEITDKDQFIYNVVQKDLQGNVVGGETYEIRKNNSRTLFFADVAGETEVNKNEPVVLIAESINEPAIYNWYNDEGELVYEGIDFTTSVAMGKEYKLEVIALSDGYKDYSDVALTLKPNAIETIYPNPATADVITVDYKINEGTSAYLSITGTYMSNVSNNYILDTNQEQIAINVSNYPLGAYIITLVTDGNISDSENLSIHYNTEIMKNIILISFLSFFLINCHGDDNTTAPNNEFPTEIEYTLIGKGEDISGGDSVDSANLVFNNSDEWNDFLATIDDISNVSNTFTETEIDFANYQIIAVIDEVKTT